MPTSVSSRRRAKIVICSAVAVAALVLSACSGNTASGANGGGGITVATQPTATGFPLWLANKLGLYAKNGLTQVNLKYYQSGADMSSAGATGAWDVGYMGAPPALTGWSKWKMIPAGGSAEEAKTQIMWGRTKDFAGKDPASVLKGGSVLVKVNSTQQYAELGCLQKFGLGLQDVKQLSLDASAIPSAFTQAQGTAAMTWPPFDASFVGNNEYTEVCNGDQAGEKIWNLLALTPTFAKAHRDKAEAYIKSVYQANDYITAHQNEAANSLIEFYKENGITEDAAAARREITQRSWPSQQEAVQLYKGPIGGQLINLVNTFVKLGAFQDKPDVSAGLAAGLPYLEGAAK